jgi:hypothetical protein
LVELSHFNSNNRDVIFDGFLTSKPFEKWLNFFVLITVDGSDEYDAKANISALVYLDKDDEAKKLSKSFFGSETYAIGLIGEDAKQPLSTDKYFQPLLP